MSWPSTQPSPFNALWGISGLGMSVGGSISPAQPPAIVIKDGKLSENGDEVDAEE